ncbi:hypothetical protein KR200_001174 [Drosophila serrata]|nr:hypothetical protein KR200_001174 [Drosophila serrata]
MTTYNDPIVGWTDNLNGPLALIYGSARGVVRVILVDPKCKISIVPADFSGNAALACAWHTGENSKREGKAEKPTIYTLGATNDNQINYGRFIGLTYEHCDRIPLEQMLWYPIILCISHRLFPLAALIFHTIPGYFFDALLVLMGRKPILTKLYKKIHKNIFNLRHFTTNSFNFVTKNTWNLFEAMSEQDRRIYNFDMERLDWTEYFTGAMDGLREYVGKEPTTKESLAKARKLGKR